MESKARLAIIGAGNIGRALAVGLVDSGHLAPDALTLTRRTTTSLQDLAESGYVVQSDNRDAVRTASIVLVAVEPHLLDGVLQEIAGDLDPSRHVLVSVVSGAGVADLRQHLGDELPIVRAMPNTAAALGESMTCLATDAGDVPENVVSMFGAIGSTLVIDEEQMIPATALCACGIAFFLRAVRAASQGGIEIGFHPEEALLMAAQTALGAAALVRHDGRHPEREIDNVTTPRGCTIAGLNQMEHQGFSSALIRGIVTSAEKAASLYAGQS